MKKNKTFSTPFITIAFCIAVLFLATSCGKTDKKNSKPVKYTKLNIETDNIRSLSASTECLVYNDAIRVDNKVFIAYKNIWQTDLDTGKTEVLFKHGLGPNEIYNADTLLLFNGRVYAQSRAAAKHLFHFSPIEGKEKQLITLSFNGKDAFTFDEYAFISENILVMAYPYLKDGFIKFFDLKKKKFIKIIGTPTFIPMMNRFNINTVSLCAHGKTLYVSESIKPEVKIIPTDTMEISGAFKLSPPFYVPLSSVKEANADKYNAANDKIWMAKWSRIRDLIAADQWLLVKYQWGWEERFNYELINLKTPHQRYYLDETPYEIFHMEIKNNHAKFTASEEREEELAWFQLEVMLK